MPDSFTTVTTKSYGKRLMDSMGGVIGGIVLFFAAFGLLYWNEGRVDLSDIAKRAQVVPAANIDAAHNGVFASVTGTVIGSEDLGDGLYLKPGPFLSLTRNVEVYAWVEQAETNSDKNLGGSETTTTKYTYKKDWVSSVPNSSEFKDPNGHQNVSPTQKSANYQAPNIQIGAYRVDGTLVELPSNKDLALTATMVELPAGATLKENKIYLGSADPAAPIVGNERISYAALAENFTGTIFGKIDGSNIGAYTDKDGSRLFQIFNGDREASLASMHNNYTTMMWILRLVGFLMMWFGLQAVIAPLSTVLDILPFLGGASRAVTGGVAFLIALVFSTLTIIISAILHSIIALLIVIALMAGAIFFVRSKKNAPAT